MRQPDLVIEIPGQPVSQNAAYQRGRGKRLFMTDVAKDWKDDCRTYALVRRQAQPYVWDVTGTYDVDCWFYFENLLCDGNNPVKLLLDSFEQVLYHKDRQVRDCLGRKRFDRENPRTVVKVYRVTEGKLTWM